MTFSQLGLGMGNGSAFSQFLGLGMGIKEHNSKILGLGIGMKNQIPNFLD
jgi:hypothetical protein